MILVDGHLDLAFNRQCFGRDPRESALAVRAREAPKGPQPWRGKCMVGLPELRAGRIALVFGTLFVPRARDWAVTGLDPALAYADREGAQALALAQLDVYAHVAGPGQGFRIVRSAADLDAVLAGWENGAAGDVGLVLLMEGADPIVDPEDAPAWFDRGVRIVGLSWRATDYSGGTGEPGPLTALGRRLLPEMRRAGLMLDLSHASEEAARESLDRFDGPVLASHSNPRLICDSDRQLPDDLIRAIGDRQGVIGAVPFNKMLRKGWLPDGRPRVPLSRVAECVHHVAQVTGTHRTAAVGSDLDGGFGAESAPEGMDTIADLPRLGDELSELGFDDDQIRDVLGRNWIRFLRAGLPAS